MRADRRGCMHGLSDDLPIPKMDGLWICGTREVKDTHFGPDIMVRRDEISMQPGPAQKDAPGSGPNREDIGMSAEIADL